VNLVLSFFSQQYIDKHVNQTGVVINGGSSGGVECAALMDDDEPPLLDTCEFGSELDALD